MKSFPEKRDCMKMFLMRYSFIIRIPKDAEIESKVNDFKIHELHTHFDRTVFVCLLIPKILSK